MWKLSSRVVTHLPYFGSAAEAPLVPWRGRIPQCQATCCQTAPQGPASSVPGAAAELLHRLRTRSILKIRSDAGHWHLVLRSHSQVDGASDVCRCKQDTSHRPALRSALCGNSMRLALITFLKGRITVG